MPFADPAPLSAADNLRIDASLFETLEATGHGEALRVWESPRVAVVVGCLGDIAREVNERACEADGVPILRRLTGGGTVVIGRGCLSYTLALSLDERPELRHVARSYRHILGRIVEAIDTPGLTIEGLSDLAIEGRKVSGNAQRRGRRALVHQGTVLYAFEIDCLERYLKPPVRQPPYRAGRRHSSFVTNLPLDGCAIAAALGRAWLPRGPEAKCSMLDLCVPASTVGVAQGQSA